MQTITWNTDTRAVTFSSLSRVPAQVVSVRGDASTETVNVVVVKGTPATPYLPDAGLNLGIVIRPPANLKQGCLAGPTLLTRGSVATDGYTGTTSTDTTLTRELMHVDTDDASSELPSLTATAVLYLVPAGGGDAIESLPFLWTISANYYRPLQPPADVVETYPDAAVVANLAASIAIAPDGNGNPSLNLGQHGHLWTHDEAPGDLWVGNGTDDNDGTQLLSGPNTLGPLDGSALTHLPASAALTGTPTAPTAAPGTNSTQIATTAFVSALVTTLTSGAPGTLDTFLEAYNRFLSDESAAAALTTTVAGKLASASNLSDLANVAAARTNLGLGSAATANVGTTTGNVAAGNTLSSVQAAALYSTTKLSPGGTPALFHFDEGTGTTAADAQSRYTATLNGGSTWATTDGGNVGSSNPRKVFAKGSAITLNGTSGYVSIPGLLDVMPASGAIECWFSPAVNYPVAGHNDRIFTKSTTDLGSGNSTRFDVYLSSGGTLTASVIWGGVGGQSVTLTSRASAWAAGSWHHLALTWGPNSLNLYVDGVLNDGTPDYSLPPNGSLQPFLVGAINYAGVTGFFQGSVDELRVLSRRPLPEEIHASYWRAPYYAGIEESGRWGARTDILTPNGTASDFRKDMVIEPSVVWDGAQFRMVYTGYCISPFFSQLGYATSPDGVTWTDHGAILGNGTHGESLNAACSNLYYEAGVFYIYYTSGYTNIRCVTTTDFATFGAPTNILLNSGAPAWAGAGYFNSCIAKDGSTYYMMVEGGNSGTGHYLMGLASATSLLGTWTVETTALTSLQQGTGAYSPGTLTPRQPDGYFHTWYHYSTSEPSPPARSMIAHARSTDLHHWEIIGGDSVVETLGEQFSGGRADQIADATLLEILGKVWLFYDLDRNVGYGGQQGRIGVTTFAGALTDLLAVSPIAARQASAQ